LSAVCQRAAENIGAPQNDTGENEGEGCRTLKEYQERQRGCPVHEVVAGGGTETAGREDLDRGCRWLFAEICTFEEGDESEEHPDGGSGTVHRNGGPEKKQGTVFAHQEGNGPHERINDEDVARKEEYGVGDSENEQCPHPAAVTSPDPSVGPPRTIDLRLFASEGYARVTVDDIARSLGTAASTIFRHFGSKEALVLWDEHDAPQAQKLVKIFSSPDPECTPFQALRDAFVGTLPLRYHGDVPFELERIGFIYRTEALHAAAVEKYLTDRNELTDALTRVLSTENKGAAPLIAGAALLALDVAIERWQKGRGAVDLGVLIYEAFASLEHLDNLR
jgi:AcrR family transcriptional regulator